MRVQIGKWGNSLAVRIPAVQAREIGLAANSEAELSIADGRLVLTPLAANARFDLDELVARITEDNRHDEIGTGSAVDPEFH